jgi:hypothetical protein
MEHFDNSWHPRRSTYKEWWYFTLFCDDGTKIAGALFVTQKDAGIWLSYYGKNNREYERMYPLPKFTASKERCEVSLGKNRFSCDDVRLEMHLEEKDIILDVTARNTARWGDNTLAYKIEDYQLHWIVPFLRGEFTGRVRIGKTDKVISGLVFHDHVWHNLKGNLDLLLNMRSWNWGIGYTKDSSLLYVHVDYKKKPFKFLCIHDKDGVHTTQDMGVKGLRFPLRDMRVGSSLGPWKVCIQKNHRVPLRNRLLEFIVGLRRAKYHGLGTFSNEKNKGEMYVEALRYH